MGRSVKGAGYSRRPWLLPWRRWQMHEALEMKHVETRKESVEDAQAEGTVGT